MGHLRGILRDLRRLQGVSRDFRGLFMWHFMGSQDDSGRAKKRFLKSSGGFVGTQGVLGDLRCIKEGFQEFHGVSGTFQRVSGKFRGSHRVSW